MEHDEGRGQGSGVGKAGTAHVKGPCMLMDTPLASGLCARPQVRMLFLCFQVGPWVERCWRDFLGVFNLRLYPHLCPDLTSWAQPVPSPCGICPYPWAHRCLGHMAATRTT